MDEQLVAFILTVLNTVFIFVLGVAYAKRKMIGSLWNSIRGRHQDGTAHVWSGPVDLGTHICESMSYCHHERWRCASCGQTKITGYAVEEIR